MNAYEDRYRKALVAIRKEARKGKPDPDVIYALANDALTDPALGKS